MNERHTIVLNRLLARLQSLLKTDVRYLIKGSAYLSLGQAFSAISGLVLTIGLVRVLDPADYGYYSYILSLVGIVGIFTHVGMDIAVAQAVAKGFDRAIITGFWSKMKWATPAALITLCIGSYYLYMNNQALGYSLIITGLLTPILSASSIYGSYFNGKKQFKRLAYDNAFKNVGIAASILIVAYLTHNVIYIILAFFLSNTLISAIRFFLLARQLPAGDDNKTIPTLSIGKHLSFMEAFGNFSGYVDRILIFQLLGATPLALYALALAPTKQLQGVSKIVRALVLPKFSTRSAAELKASMSRKIVTFFLASLAITVGYWILAELLFVYVFPKYEGALLYSQILSLGLLFMPAILYVQALTTLSKKRDLYIVNITKSITKILLLIVLVPLFGIWGAIIAFLLTHFTNTLILAVLFHRIKVSHSAH